MKHNFDLEYAQEIAFLGDSAKAVKSELNRLAIKE